MSYKIIGKYIKELNFNIPNTKTFYLLSKDIVNYKINIDIKSNRIKHNIIEILTSLNLSPTKENFEIINTKIIFATIIELENDKVEKSQLEKIILVDVPSKIYGELRRIFVSLFENSGFKDVKISENVDFLSLYNMKKSQ
ncbi:protein-export chaperone SecB [Candidatus Pelagibacter communis]|uniref:protein-export chaperone SecB n=1 Tax=Pelagibacter ubique TaxID=198252 RepID=UPI00094BF5A0|nr:protein-export chaperone SecB [Candidatus Pelagibacter ubique]